jgi:short-subunit dehydrogenase
LGHRLKIHGLDLSTHSECGDFLHRAKKYKRLDILINNAAQTVRRPAGFYTHLMENEERSIASLPQQAQELLLDHTNCLDD